MGVSIRFLGATGTVTGSKFLVTAGGARLLVDCGLFQGYKQLRLRNWAPPPFEAAGIAAVALTHAHIDHSGHLPVLARMGWKGRVLCTESTFELCRILLPDAAWLQEEQAEHANRHGWSKHKPALPLYTRADAARALELFHPVPFGREVEACPGVRLRFTPAGHILGAACATLAAEGRTLVFSGDLGRPDDPIMRAPEALAHADALVMESTYGDRLHDPADPADALGEAVRAAAARGGTVVVPAFAVGRAQLLLLLLHRLKAAGGIPAAMPVYLDSPMATDVTGLYLRSRAEHRLDEAECRSLARTARQVASPGESKALDRSPWPKVIIAGSGMASGGRVLHHIKRYGPDPRAMILFTGFQAGGTRGEAMVHGATEVKIHGAYVPIRAEVRNLEGMSAHADRDDLLAWLGRFRRAPGRLFLVHGEPGAADTLRRQVAEKLGWRAEVPDYLEQAEVAAAG